MDNRDNDLSEGFKMPQLGPIPDEWEVASLGDVFREIDVRVARFQDQNADRLPVLSLTKNYGLMLQSERFGKRIALDDVSNYKVVKRGEIVYNPYVIWEGAIHILDKFDYGLVSPVYPVLETNPERADAYFLDSILRTPLAITAYNRFAAGAVNRRRSIRKTDFMAICVPLPPLPEQRAIARVLSTIQQAIETQGNLIAASRELKKSLMRHLFSYGPVPISEAEHVLLKMTQFGPLPDEWEAIPLTQSLVKTRCNVPDSIQRGEYKPAGKYPIVDQGEKYVAGYTDDAKKIYSSSLPTIIFGDHTRIFKFVDFPFAIGADGTKILSPNTQLFHPKYLYYSLTSLDIPSRGYNRHFGILKEKTVIRPPLPEQQEIASILSAVDQKIEAEKKRKSALQSLFQTMLHLLMTGKIRLRELNSAEE